MTSSDDTALPPGAITDAAQIVGHSYEGGARGPARVAIVCAKFNGGITVRLLDGALGGLKDHGVALESVDRGLGARCRRAPTGRLASAAGRGTTTP